MSNTMAEFPPALRAPKPKARRVRRPQRSPGKFITASQALQSLADPEGSALGPSAAYCTSEARWVMAKAALIAAHTKGALNLLGRKGEVAPLGTKANAFERIPNQTFAQNVILGDNLIARPGGRGSPAAREFWRDVKMPRHEFEAEFKFSNAEDDLREWWKEKTALDGKPPTERDAYLLFALAQKPRLPRRWLCKELKKFPESWRRKGSGRPPDSQREAAREAREAAKQADKQAATARAESQKRERAAPIEKAAKKKRPRPDYRHIIRQKQTTKTSAGWKVNIKRRRQYMHKYFADSKFGGKENALEAAKAYLDSLMSVASDPDYRLWRMNKKTEANVSGIVGVGRYAVRYRKRKKLLWQAIWQDADGKRHCKRFFVETHGERQAKALACEARRQAMDELHDELTRRGEIYD